MFLNVNNFTLFKGLILKFMSKVGVHFHIVEQMFKDLYKLELHIIIKIISRRYFVAQSQAID